MTGRKWYMVPAAWVRAVLATVVLSGCGSDEAGADFYVGTWSPDEEAVAAECLRQAVAFVGRERDSFGMEWTEDELRENPGVQELACHFQEMFGHSLVLRPRGEYELLFPSGRSSGGTWVVVDQGRAIRLTLTDPWLREELTIQPATSEIVLPYRDGTLHWTWESDTLLEDLPPYLKFRRR